MTLISSLLHLANVICCPRIFIFFQMILGVFHFGIWSSMLPSHVDLVLKHLLPLDLKSKLLFVYEQEKCVKRKPYPFFEKVLNRLTVDTTCFFCKV